MYIMDDGVASVVCNKTMAKPWVIFKVRSHNTSNYCIIHQGPFACSYVAYHCYLVELHSFILGNIQTISHENKNNAHLIEKPISLNDKEFLLS